MNAPLSALVFHRSFSARSSRIKRFGTRCYALRGAPGGYRHILERMCKRAGWRAWMVCSSRPSRPLRSKTGRAPPCGSMWAEPCAAAGLACGTRAPTTGGAMRSAGLWAARRSERPWREPPAYADRIGRSAFDSSYSRNRDRRITALSRACICESDGSGAGTSATGNKRESASAGT